MNMELAAEGASIAAAIATKRANTIHKHVEDLEMYFVNGKLMQHYEGVGERHVNMPFTNIEIDDNTPVMVEMKTFSV